MTGKQKLGGLMGKGITLEDMRKIAKERGVKKTERKTFHQCLEAMTETTSATPQ